MSPSPAVRSLLFRIVTNPHLSEIQNMAVRISVDRWSATAAAADAAAVASLHIFLSLLCSCSTL